MYDVQNSAAKADDRLADGNDPDYLAHSDWEPKDIRHDNQSSSEPSARGLTIVAGESEALLQNAMATSRERCGI